MEHKRPQDSLSLSPSLFQWTVTCIQNALGTRLNKSAIRISSVGQGLTSSVHKIEIDGVPRYIAKFQNHFDLEPLQPIVLEHEFLNYLGLLNNLPFVVPTPLGLKKIARTYAHVQTYIAGPLLSVGTPKNLSILATLIYDVTILLNKFLRDAYPAFFNLEHGNPRSFYSSRLKSEATKYLGRHSPNISFIALDKALQSPAVRRCYIASKDTNPTNFIERGRAFAVLDFGGVRYRPFQDCWVKLIDYPGFVPLAMRCKAVSCFSSIWAELCGRDIDTDTFHYMAVFNNVCFALRNFSPRSHFLPQAFEWNVERLMDSAVILANRQLLDEILALVETMKRRRDDDS